MNRAPVFEAFRAILGRGLTQAEVNRIDAAFEEVDGSDRKPTELAGPATFFRAVRVAFGALTQEQVDGFNALLAAMGEAGWPRSWVAYGLATAWWETNKTMQPVEEAYYLEGKVADLDAWRRKNLRYYPWHGRGYPQTSWEKNYRWADEELGLNGALLADPSLMLKPDIAAQTMVRGMEQGAFTGKRLADYLPIDGQAGHDAFERARRIINGNDKAAQIAKQALAFDAALEAGGWA